MGKANESIRQSIETQGLRYWQVAEEIGIHFTTFTEWLRVDLTDERKEKVMKAIEQLTDKVGA